MTQASFKKTVADAFGRQAKIYDQYARVQRLIADDLAGLCAETLPANRDNGRYLEIGCGTGLSFGAIGDHPGLSAWRSQPVLSDIALPMVQAACASHHVQGVVMDGELTCFRPQIFGLIVASMVAHWFIDRALAFARLAPLLCPGGRLVLAVPVTPSLSAWQRLCCDQDAGVIPFADYDDILSDLRGAGLMINAASTTTYAIDYPCEHSFLKELKHLGAATGRPGYRLKGLRQLLAQAAAARHGKPFIIDWTIALVIACRPVVGAIGQGQHRADDSGTRRR